MDKNSLLDETLRLSPPQRQALARLKLFTPADLLYYFPHRYERELPQRPIGKLRAGETATICGRVVKQKIGRAWRKKIPLAEAVVADQTGTIKAVWFRQPYLAKQLTLGRAVRLSGRVTTKGNELYFANPQIETITVLTDSLFDQEKNGGANRHLIPVYPESRSISSNWFHHTIKKIIQAGIQRQLTDPLPEFILKKYRLPKLTDALLFIHLPRKEKEAEAARKRFAFEEVFLIQLGRLRTKSEYEKHGAFVIKPKPEVIDEFIKNLPFPLTQAQKRAVEQILKDFTLNKPMTRLLEGDVGSGKTVVAAITALTCVKSGLETAYMAPTEILARQHFQSFIQHFRGQDIKIGLITSGECRKFPSKISPETQTRISRSQLLKWVANGEIPILIGTHALIQKKVKFKNLAYVIIDEQHRFGVKQRALLVRKSTRLPHLLSMTATPIPRTLALTVYGDLDLTLLDELPPGRQTIITKIITEKERSAAYEQVRTELNNGRQAYVICPRIDEPDPQKELALQAKSARAERDRLKQDVFPEFEIGLMHGRLKPREKEKIMNDFLAGQIKILVATSVVEVGVNIPNATIIIIEGAERFGLAQLHQLRGRVMRSSFQPYCFLFSENAPRTTSAGRLKALLTAKNGFELAELDLQLRGPGALSGIQQWGISDVGMEALKNLKMVEAARAEAQEILREDPGLKNFPFLKNLTERKLKQTHWE